MLRNALFALCGFLALGGCGNREDPLIPLSIVASAGDEGLSGVGSNAMPDPIKAATISGLVGYDEQGRVVPALADRWIVTEDGTSYIFRLRNGIWPGGAPITGEAVASLLRTALKGLRKTPLGQDLAPITEIRAMAGRVVEIRLSSPLPELLALLAQPELGLAPKGKGSGPMDMDRQGAVTQLEPIPPQRLGLPEEEDWAERARVLRVRVEPADKAIARFDAGYAELVLGGQTDTLPLVKTAGISRGTVRLDPVTGLFGLVFLNDTGLFAEPGNREAMSRAIDRDALLAPFNVAGWSPTTRIVPAELDAVPTEGGERWSTLTIEQRQLAAAARISAWRAARGDIPPVRIALPPSPGGNFIFEQLSRDLGAIGLATVRVDSGDAADLRLIDRVAVYNSADWFFQQLSCASRRFLCSAEADQALAGARAALDPAVRDLLRAEARNLLTAANTYIPFARPLRWSLVRADVTGFAVNPRGVHPLLPLALSAR